MPSRRVRNRLEKIPAVSDLAFAAGEVAVEAVRRSTAAPRPGALAPDTDALGPVFRRDCRYVGWEIQVRGGTMLDADRALDTRRTARRRKIARRQELCDLLYDEMVEVRRTVMGYLGRKQGREYFRGLGPTSRDPVALCRQASVLGGSLSHPETAPRPPIAWVRPDWAAMARSLEDQRAALDEAVREAYRAARSVQVALRNQQRAIAAFDEIHGTGARYLETLLEMLGLPSLAAQVRPGVSRRGRPRKNAPIDVYPDLIERALQLAGLSVRTEASSESPKTVAGGSSEDLSDARQKAPGASDSDQKIARGLRKQRRRRKKIVHGLRKLPAGGQKTARGLRKLPDGDQKSVQGLHKLDQFSVKLEESTFKDKRSAAAPTSRLRRLRETASAWWTRRRQAA